jgi:hypothetical protein
MSSRSSSTTTLSRSSAVICSYQMSRNRALEHPRFDHGRTLDDTRSKTAEPTGVRSIEAMSATTPDIAIHGVRDRRIDGSDDRRGSARGARLIYLPRK